MYLIIYTFSIIMFLTEILPGSEAGDVSESDQMNKPIFSFGLIADVQYADYEPAGTRHYRSSLSKLKQSLEILKKDSVDFVITLGDLIDRDMNSYKPVIGIMESSGLKFHNVTGNHDYSIEKKYRGRLPSEYVKKPGYYSFSQYNFRFIFLNGNEISIYGASGRNSLRSAGMLLDSLKGVGAVNARDWNGGIGSKQLTWLVKQLDEARENKEKVFIFCHFPIFPDNEHNLLNDKEVLNHLVNYNNIVAWMNGHSHAGNYGNTNSVHYVTLKGMVETSDENSFARIDVYSNKIWISGYGRERSKILAY